MRIRNGKAKTRKQIQSLLDDAARLIETADNLLLEAIEAAKEKGGCDDLVKLARIDMTLTGWLVDGDWPDEVAVLIGKRLALIEADDASVEKAAA
jgi:hypothetical protein